jgi:hypothetical protein
VRSGGYNIEYVIVSNDIGNDQPAYDDLVFHRTDTIFCTVNTTGIDGIVGVRWFFGTDIISETIGRTQNNILSSYIKAESAEGLPEGSYHVEVFVIEDQPVKTIFFTVTSDSSQSAVVSC